VPQPTTSGIGQRNAQLSRSSRELWLRARSSEFPGIHRPPRHRADRDQKKAAPAWNRGGFHPVTGKRYLRIWSAAAPAVAGVMSAPTVINGLDATSLRRALMRGARRALGTAGRYCSCRRGV